MLIDNLSNNFQTIQELALNEMKSFKIFEIN